MFLAKIQSIEVPEYVTADRSIETFIYISDEDEEVTTISEMLPIDMPMPEEYFSMDQKPLEPLDEVANEDSPLVIEETLIDENYGGLAVDMDQGSISQMNVVSDNSMLEIGDAEPQDIQVDLDELLMDHEEIIGNVEPVELSEMEK